MSAVDKDHRPGRFVLLWQVLLVNAVGQGGGRGLVHQLQHVQAAHLGRVEQGAPLGIGEVRGNTEENKILILEKYIYLLAGNQLYEL